MKFNIKSVSLMLFMALNYMGVYAQTNIACNGEHVCIALDSVRGNVQWQMSSDSINWSNLNGETNDSLCMDVSGSGYYRAFLLTQEGCDTVFSDAIGIIISDLAANAGPDISYCSGSAGIIGSVNAASGGAGGYSYSWSPTTSLSNPTDSVTATATNSSMYYILSVIDGMGCTATDTVNVSVEMLGNGDTTYFALGGPEYFIVPSCNDSIFIELWGAAGQNGNGTNGGTGGLGGYVSGYFNATPGDTLEIWTGVSGYTFAGAAQGGGSATFAGGTGGGFSGVKVKGSSTFIAIAGGGGGGGGAGSGTNATCFGGAGGTGGGLVAGNGTAPVCGSLGPGFGTGGTQSTGGTGGNGHVSCAVASDSGDNGSQYQGGDGGTGSAVGGSCTMSGAGGGGGGGGYYGGGGGGAGASGGGGSFQGGGGGGGSSYVGGLTNSTNTPGVQTGDGKVIVHW